MERLLEQHEDSLFLTEDEVKGMEKLTACTLWASKFMHQNGMKSIALHGEAGDVDHAAVEPDIQKLRDIIKKFNPDSKRLDSSLSSCLTVATSRPRTR